MSEGSMKTQYYTASSVDGFIADPNHSLDWLFQFGDAPDGEPQAGDYPGFIKQVGAITMGAHTYEWIVNHEKLLEPGSTRRWPYEQPSWVFTSRDLPNVRGGDIRLVRGDVRPVHREMTAAAGGKNVWVVGGGELAGQFFDAGLLDEIYITFASVTLGRGFPLFPRRSPALRLVSAEMFNAGFAHLKYEIPTAGTTASFSQ
jgi:dihydrofolate reductase